MATKKDVQDFAKLVRQEVASELGNLAENKAELTDKLRYDIYGRIFHRVGDLAQEVGLKASNELVNCIAQVLYGSVRINGSYLDTEIFSEIIDPRKLPENERPFVYAFFQDEDEPEALA